MAARVALVGFQLALIAWTQRNRTSVAESFRALTARLYGRDLKPWQLRAYRRAALTVLVLTAAYDVAFLFDAA